MTGFVSPTNVFSRPNCMDCDSNLPTFSLFVRSKDALKEEMFRLFGVSDHHFQHLVAAPGGTVCELNPRFREMASTETLRILHCGLPLVHRMRHGGWKICPEGAQRLATMATKRKHMVHGEEILSLLLHRTLPLNQSDGPYLLQVDVNSHGFWLSGDVVNGHLSLETPEDVLQRLRLCVLKNADDLGSTLGPLVPGQSSGNTTKKEIILMQNLHFPSDEKIYLESRIKYYCEMSHHNQYMFIRIYIYNNISYVI